MSGEHVLPPPDNLPAMPDDEAVAALVSSPRSHPKGASGPGPAACMAVKVTSPVRPFLLSGPLFDHLFYFLKGDTAHVPFSHLVAYLLVCFLTPPGRKRIRDGLRPAPRLLPAPSRVPGVRRVLNKCSSRAGRVVPGTAMCVHLTPASPKPWVAAVTVPVSQRAV